MGGRAGAGGRRAAGAGAWAGLGVDLGRMLALPPALRAALGRCAPRLPSAAGCEPRALSSPAAEPIATEPARARAVEADSILHKAMHHDIPRARAVRKRFKTSVKKLNLVCKLVRRARVDAALMQLSLNPKRVATTVRKAIYDAKFNAANNHGMDPDRLIVDEILVGRSTYLKRVEYKGRGRTGVRKKPFCYMAVYVREIQDSDQFVHFHLKRRKPRWKCGPIK